MTQLELRGTIIFKIELVLRSYEMTYKQWMTKVNEFLKPYRRFQVQNKNTRKAYLDNVSPEQFVNRFSFYND